MATGPSNSTAAGSESHLPPPSPPRLETIGDESGSTTYEQWQLSKYSFPRPGTLKPVFQKSTRVYNDGLRFNDGDTADLSIALGDGTTLSVHQQVVFQHSKYLEERCSGSLHYPLGRTPVLHMKEDSPEVVRSLLQHFYDNEYHGPSIESDAEASTMVFVFQLYQLAVKVASSTRVFFMHCLAKAAENSREGATEADFCAAFRRIVASIYSATAGGAPEQGPNVRIVVRQIARNLIGAAALTPILNDFPLFANNLAMRPAPNFEPATIIEWRCSRRVCGNMPATLVVAGPNFAMTTPMCNLCGGQLSRDRASDTQLPWPASRRA